MGLKMPDKVVSPPAQPWDIDCSGDVPLTKQEFRDDCDVNKILARCLKSGLPLPSSVAEPLFADVSEIGSYADCLRRVSAGEEAFMQLPAEMRSQFGNQAGNLIAFLADPANRAKAIELGLVNKPVEAMPPVPVPVVPVVPVVLPAK